MQPAVFCLSIDPNIIRKGDKIRIKGILMDDAKEFSINFVNEHCSNPAFITYHFKWLLDIHAIVENYKDNGMWINHLEQDFDGINGVFLPEHINDNQDKEDYSNNSNNDNENNELSVLGPIFELEFTFHQDEIHVYRIIHNTPNYITTYEPFFGFEDIKALQVWGDVRKITELSFKFGA